jgi:hypothetical protein
MPAVGRDTVGRDVPAKGWVFGLSQFALNNFESGVLDNQSVLTTLISAGQTHDALAWYANPGSGQQDRPVSNLRSTREDHLPMMRIVLKQL